MAFVQVCLASPFIHCYWFWEFGPDYGKANSALLVASNISKIMHLSPVAWDSDMGQWRGTVTCDSGVGQWRVTVTSNNNSDNNNNDDDNVDNDNSTVHWKILKIQTDAERAAGNMSAQYPHNRCWLQDLSRTKLLVLCLNSTDDAMVTNANYSRMVRWDDSVPDGGKGQGRTSRQLFIGTAVNRIIHYATKQG